MKPVFFDRDGVGVAPNSLPVGKIYVVVAFDPEYQSELPGVLVRERMWASMYLSYVTRYLEPEPYEQIVFTTATDMAHIAVHAGLVESLREAREFGFSGPIPWGLELYGIASRSIWIWSMNKPSKPSTIGKKRIRTTWWWEFVETMRGRLP